MDIFVEWLEEPVLNYEIIGHILKMSLLCIVYVCIFCLAMSYFCPEYLDSLRNEDAADLLEQKGWIITLVLVLASVFEELTFRLLPIIFFSIFVDEVEIDWKLISVVIVSSVLFGVFHGSLNNIPLQGVLGVLFCIVFLKNGGLQKKYIRATLASISVHLSYNVIVFVVAAVIKSSI